MGKDTKFSEGNYAMVLARAYYYSKTLNAIGWYNKFRRERLN